MTMAAERLAGPSMLGLVGDMSGPTLWRVLWPFTALEKRGYPCGWDFNHASGVGAVAPGFEGYVLARLSWQAGQRSVAERWFDIIRRAGHVVIYDCDDDLFNPEVDRRSVAFGWAGGKTLEDLDRARAERVWAVQQCDGVTVSTQRLATVVRTITDRPVIVVPNAIDLAWFRTVLRGQGRQLPQPVIGWAGGRRPDEDVAVMAEAWGRVAKLCPAVRFVVGGYVPPSIRENIPPDRLVIVPWLPIERYPAGLADVDIACCSVADTAFNRSKSSIKAIEAAVAGAVVVATPTVYGSLVENGRTGYLAETVDEWEAHLMDLVERPALRAIVARRLLRVVEKRHTLEANLWRWPAAWSAIAEDARARRGRLVTA
jgi:glycosyltransferase involved in cell wall biosynthesis